MFASEINNLCEWFSGNLTSVLKGKVSEKKENLSLLLSNLNKMLKITENSNINEKTYSKIISAFYDATQSLCFTHYSNVFDVLQHLCFNLTILTLKEKKTLKNPFKNRYTKLHFILKNLDKFTHYVNNILSEGEFRIFKKALPQRISNNEALALHLSEHPTKTILHEINEYFTSNTSTKPQFAPPVITPELLLSKKEMEINNLCEWFSGNLALMLDGKVAEMKEHRRLLLSKLKIMIEITRDLNTDENTYHKIIFAFHEATYSLFLLDDSNASLVLHDLCFRLTLTPPPEESFKDRHAKLHFLLENLDGSMCYIDNLLTTPPTKSIPALYYTNNGALACYLSKCPTKTISQEITSYFTPVIPGQITKQRLLASSLPDGNVELPANILKLVKLPVIKILFELFENILRDLATKNAPPEFKIAIIYIILDAMRYCLENFTRSGFQKSSIENIQQVSTCTQKQLENLSVIPGGIGKAKFLICNSSSSELEAALDGKSTQAKNKIDTIVPRS